MSESIITLGIGATSDLDWFITSGLHCTPAAPIFSRGANAATVPRRDRVAYMARRQRAANPERQERAGYVPRRQRAATPPRRQRAAKSE